VLLRAVSAPESVDLVDARQYEVDTRREAESYLASVADTLRPGIDVTTVVTSGQPPSEAIVKAAAERLMDAIVMATHGRSGLPHLLYGSVTESVLASSKVPVFVVRARPGVTTAAFDPSAPRVLVPLDGSSFAESALPTASQLVGTAGKLILTCAVYPPDHIETDPSRRHVVAYLDQIEEARTREAREYLTTVAHDLQQRNPSIRASVQVSIHHNAAAGIASVAKEQKVDVIVMTTHGRTRLRRAVTGSVAGALLRESGVPVVLVGPAAAERAAEPAAAVSSPA
jgi:nucleotide-binding universal stress UspA family protein